MINLTRTQIMMLRAYGYPMKGDNWLCADQPDSNLSNQGVVKVVDGDTLAIVHLPVGLLKETLT